MKVQSDMPEHRSFGRAASTTLFALGALAVMQGTALASPRHDAAARDAEAVAEVSRLTVILLENHWRRLPNEPEFSFKDRVGAFYDWSAKDVYFFDEGDGERVIARSTAELAEMADQGLRGVSFTSHADGAPDVVASGTLAVATVYYTFEGMAPDGPVMQKMFDTIVWRKTAAGWKIIREQGSRLTRPSTAPKN